MNVSSLVVQILKITCLDGVFESAHEQEIRSPDLLDLVLEDSMS
jgi:hypothetical protein